MIEAQQARQMQPLRILGLPLVAWLVGVVVACMLFGVVFAAASSHDSAPTFPPGVAPPRARSLGTSQVTPELGASQITSLAIYESAASPMDTIAYYRRVLPDHGGKIGRFAIVVRSADPGALPTALQDLPASFADGKGKTARTNYTFTEYEVGNKDMGIAVDLRHPHGPTLVCVEMLSS